MLMIFYYAPIDLLLQCGCRLLMPPPLFVFCFLRCHFSRRFHFIVLPPIFDYADAVLRFHCRHFAIRAMLSFILPPPFDVTFFATLFFDDAMMLFRCC